MILDCFCVRPNHFLLVMLYCSPNPVLRCSFYTSVLEIPLRFAYDILLPHSPLRQQIYMLHSISLRPELSNCMMLGFCA